MFIWEKLGRVFNPLDVTDRDWLKEYAQAPCVLFYKDFVRVFFSCRPSPDANGVYTSRSAYLDLKRSNLKEILRISDQPIFQLGERGTFDEFGTYPVSVLRHDNKVLAYYAGWTRCESVPFNVAIGMAESYDDGYTFNKIGNGGPVISYSPDEPFVMSGPKIRRFNDRFYLFYIAGRKWKLHEGKPEPVYKIRMATSMDGINWTKHGKDLIESRIEEDEAQASPDVIFLNGKYHMFFCFRYSTGFRSHEKGYRIGYASSDDLLHWTRNDEIAGLDVSAEGWDSEMVAYPHVFELDGKIYMFYLGDQVGRFGFGLARLNQNNSKI